MDIGHLSCTFDSQECVQLQRSSLMRMKLRTVLSNLIQQQYFRHIFRLVGEVCDIFEDQRVCQVPADINVICDGRYCKYQAEL